MRYVPILRGNTYSKVNTLLEEATKIMVTMGVGEHYYSWIWWSGIPRKSKLGDDQSSWPPKLRIVWKFRTTALKTVVREVVDQFPNFSNLTNCIEYRPDAEELGSSLTGGATTFKQRPYVVMGDGAFGDPRNLVRAVFHEGRHIWQTDHSSYIVQPGDNLSKIAQRYTGDASRWRELYQWNADVIANPNLIRTRQRLYLPEEWGSFANVGPFFSGPTAFAEADAYLFGIRHRNLSAMGPIKTAQDLTELHNYLVADSQLRHGLSVSSRYTDEGITYPMGPVALQHILDSWNQISPDVCREVQDYTNQTVWQHMCGGSGGSPSQSFLHTL